MFRKRRNTAPPTPYTPGNRSSSTSVVSGAQASKRRRLTSSSSAVVRSAPGSISRSGGSVVRNLVTAAAMSSPYARTAIRGYQLARSAARLGRNTGYVINRIRRRLNPGRGGSGRVMSSKSSGWFNEKLSKSTAMDQYANKGFVTRLENNDSVSTSRQVAYVAHSTMPAQTVALTCVKAMIKKLINITGNDVKSELELILEGTSYDQKLVITYKMRDGSSVSDKEFPIARATATLQSLANDYVTFFNALGAVQFLRAKIFSVYTWGVELLIDTDLTSARFKIFSKSRLKIQNRSINSVGNNESDDVDNVPLYGKSYDYKTNGTIYRDYPVTAATTSAITTNVRTGVLPSTQPVEDPKCQMYTEPPLPSQFVGCKGVRSAKLDPGDIKTSVMYDSVNMSFQYFHNQIMNKGGLYDATGRFIQYWIGKTRLFAFEKMIASAATADNNIKLQQEHQLDIGAIFTVRRIKHTAPGNYITTGGNDSAVQA